MLVEAIPTVAATAPVVGGNRFLGVGESKRARAHTHTHTQAHTHSETHVFALVGGFYGPYLYARVRVREYVARH